MGRGEEGKGGEGRGDGLKLRTCLWTDPVWLQFPQRQNVNGRSHLEPHDDN